MSSAVARRVYVLTFITYALIHGVRTSWSYIKTYSQKEPLEFSTQFLGELDMIVLICLAVSLKTLGWIGEKIGYKNFLLIGMSYLTLSFMVMGILQFVGVKKHWVYIMLYAMVGVASCTGWPSCLSVLIAPLRLSLSTTPPRKTALNSASGTDAASSETSSHWDSAIYSSRSARLDPKALSSRCAGSSCL